MRRELRFLLAALAVGFCVRVGTRIAGLEGAQGEIIGLTATALFVVTALVALDRAGSGASGPR